MKILVQQLSEFSNERKNNDGKMDIKHHLWKKLIRVSRKYDDNGKKLMISMQANDDESFDDTPDNSITEHEKTLHSGNK